MSDDVREAALRLLDYRDRSVKELRERLLEKEYPGEAIERVIYSLQSCGLLDDRRYAEWFIRSKLSAGKGRVYIANKLREKGISAEVLEDAMTEIFQEQDEKLLCLKKALAICSLSHRFEVTEEGEILPVSDFTQSGKAASSDDTETGGTEPVGFFEPKDEAIRSDRHARYVYREKAKAKLTRRLISAGFPAGTVFDAVKKIEQL